MNNSLDKSFFEEWRKCASDYDEKIEKIFRDDQDAYLVRDGRIVSGLISIDQYKSEFPSKLEKKIQAQRSCYEELLASRLSVWLSREPGFIRALGYLGRRRSGENPTEQFRQKAIRDINRCESTMDVYENLSSIHLRFVGGNYWRFSLVRALEGYLFLDHDAIFKSKKTLASNAERLREITKEIDPYMSSIGFKSHSLDAAIRRLETFAPYEHELRNSQFKAEQYFVREMCRINKYFFRVPKPEMISELMTISCFRHSYDTRHIAKVCSQIALAQSQRKSRKDAMAGLRYAES